MLKKHWGLRIVLGVAAGFIISVMLCFILIFIGYTTVYRGNLSEYHVNIFGWNGHGMPVDTPQVSCFGLRGLAGALLGLAAQRCEGG